MLLTAAATGAHIRMMCTSWEHGPIPDHPTALAKAMSLGPADPPYLEIWTEIQHKWALTKKGWICRRLEKTREEQEAYRQKRQKAGQKGALSRYGRHAIAIAEPSLEHSPSPSPSIPSPSPSLSSPPPSGEKKRLRVKTSLVVEPDEFKTFYQRYPRKEDRASALKAWNALNPSPEVIRAIHSALDWQIAQPGWVKDSGKFIPYPATWINRRRWEDEPFDPVSASDPNEGAWGRVLGRIGNGNR